MTLISEAPDLTPKQAFEMLNMILTYSHYGKNAHNNDILFGDNGLDFFYLHIDWSMCAYGLERRFVAIKSLNE